MSQKTNSSAPKASGTWRRADEDRTVEEMPRRPRLELPDGIAHLTSRGNRRGPIFLDALDYDWFLEDLAAAVARFAWTCLAFALLPNHFHVVVDAKREAISVGMHWLNGRHARRFNRRRGLTGHLFEDRFDARAVQTDAHLLSCLSYVALNTWKARLCTHPAVCKRTSHRYVAGLAPAPAFLAIDRVLALWSDDRVAARRRYVQFIENALAAERDTSR
jgi:putative transposase